MPTVLRENDCSKYYPLRYGTVVAMPMDVDKLYSTEYARVAAQ